MNSNFGNSEYLRSMLIQTGTGATSGVLPGGYEIRFLVTVIVLEHFGWFLSNIDCYFGHACYGIVPTKLFHENNIIQRNALTLQGLLVWFP